MCTDWTHPSRKFLLTAQVHLVDSARVESTLLGGVHEQVEGSGTSGPAGGDQCDGSKGFNDPQHTGKHNRASANYGLVGR